MLNSNLAERSDSASAALSLSLSSSGVSSDARGPQTGLNSSQPDGRVGTGAVGGKLEVLALGGCGSWAALLG